MTLPTKPKYKAGPGRPPSNLSVADKKRSKNAAVRLREYKKDLPDIAMQDMPLLENLVYIELQMEFLRGKMFTALDGSENKKIADALSDYSKEYRQTQDALGIGRSQRKPEVDMQKEIDKLVSESEVLVEASGRRITCPHCTSDYDMGILLFHFIGDVPWKFDFICPDCGKPVHMESVQSWP